MTEQVEVKIVGDASDAVAATDRVKSAVSESVGTMRGKLNELQGTSTEAFGAMGTAAKLGADRVQSAARDTSEATSRMKSATDGAASGFSGMGLAASGVKAVVGTLVASLSIGAFTAAASRALDYASSLAEVAQQLGVTTRDLQEYRYAATQVGISQEDMDKGLARLTLTMGKAREGAKGPAAAFEHLSALLGKDILKSAQSAGDAIPLISDALKKIEDPAQRAALEVALFGKTGQKLDTLLAGGSGAVNELRDAAQSLGIVLSDAQIQNADKTADKLSELKTVLEANISAAVADNADSIYRLATAFADLISWAGRAARALRDYGFEAGQALRSASGWTMLGGRAAGDNAARARSNYFQASVQHDNEVAARTPSDKPPPVVRPATTGVGAGAGRPSGGSAGSGPSAPKGPSVVERWRAELSELLEQEKNWSADEAQLSADFWTKKLAQTKAGSADALGIERERNRARRAARNEDIQDEAATIRAEAEMRQTAAQSEIDDARIALTGKLALLDQQEKRGEVGNATAAKRRAELNRQLYQIDLEEADREYRIKIDALQREAEINGLKTAARDDLLRQIRVLEAQHEATMRLRRKQAAQQESADAAQVLQARRQQFSGIASAWGQALARMATLQAGFGTTFRSLWGSLVGIFQQAIARMIELWILSLVTKEATSKTFNAKQILMDAKAAAAGAWRAVVGIPVVGPILAPIAAAAAFAGVMAFSAKDGYDVPAMSGPGIDGRGGQVGIVHPREMILPEELADKVRNGLGGGGGTIIIQAVDAESVRRLAMRHGAALAEGLRHHARGNGNVGKR